MHQPLRKIVPAQLICMALLLCYLPSADGRINPHLPVPCRPPTTHHKTRPSKYPQMHVSSPICMKPLMLSFDPRIYWKQARTCLISSNFLAQPPFRILSPISSSSAEPSTGSFLYSHMGSDTRRKSLPSSLPHPGQRFQSPDNPICRPRLQN